MARIEDYYLASDGNDWLPVITRAQQEFHTLADPTGTPAFTLEFGPSQYFFSDTIRLARSMHLVGAAGKLFSTVLAFAPDKGGISCAGLSGTTLVEQVTKDERNFTVASSSDMRVGDILVVDAERVKVTAISGTVVGVQRAAQGTTATKHLPGTAIRVLGFRSDNSIIERITLLSGGGSSATAHGITMHRKIALRDVAIAQFPGDGIHIEATLPAGNAISWEISNVQINNCGGDGLSVEGSAAGFGYASLLVCQDNKGWAIRDHSAELGNTYVSCTAEGAGGGINTRRPGGASPRSVFINCDVEVGGKSTIDLPTMVINSPIQNLTGNAVVLGATPQGAFFSSGVSAISPVVRKGDDPTTGRQVIASLGAFEQILGALSLRIVEGPVDSQNPGEFSGAQHLVAGSLDLLYDYIVPGWWGLYWNKLNGSPLRISTREADVGEA